ncbi:hypothetical protein [Pseudoflavonifractor sp. An184]|uniref:hypothetical protein n=1 Tax=Pseudoflavonifractor sp. An184 TaxID=1965576 RepID=UPI000B39606F|nr:hypothetical protein [Pseudoflavonifractor sp. An184]OUP54910.1 hypothetical protein B5F19_10460 [Pseudoflavonifractor sp. An184]
MPKKKKTATSGELVMVKSVHRTRSRRMKFCVHGGLGDTLNKQRRKPDGYPGALLADFIPNLKYVADFQSNFLPISKLRTSIKKY